jgi:hypothetical protein
MYIYPSTDRWRIERIETQSESSQTRRISSRYGETIVSSDEAYDEVTARLDLRSVEES